MNAIVPIKLRTGPATQLRPLIRIVIVGEVDHGKSTLIGRLLHETGSLPDGKLEHLKAVSARRGMPFEWSFLLDALQTERDHGITIDTSQIRFRTSSRDFVLIDAPGHAEFLRNMITGAAQADAAILIIDATEGVRDQTRRHGYLLHLLGIRELAVVINKMDRIAYDATRFREIETEITDYLSGLGMVPTAVIPVSARDGAGITQHTYTLEWYRPTVVQALESFTAARTAAELPLRLPVQAIYKFDDRRIIAGRIESGTLAVGDEIMLLPSRTSARVKSIEAWPAGAPSGDPAQAAAGHSVGITLDRELFVDRGDLISAATAPASTGRSLRARVFWLHQKPLGPGARVIVRAGTAAVRATLTSIRDAIDPGQLVPADTRELRPGHIAEIELALSQPLAIDSYSGNPATGRIALEFDGRIAGGGLVLDVESESRAPETLRRTEPDRTALEQQAQQLARRIAAMSPAQRVARLRSELAGTIVFTTSFGIEDQVILHLLSEQKLDIDVVTLDTGRLFPETYELWAETERRYGLRIRAFYPRHNDLENLVQRQGINGFYESREARAACCEIRKAEPLNRALAGARAWITGLRADQSAHRQGLGLVAADAERNLLKLSPLFDWTRETTLDFVERNDVPINHLHAQGFVSIGCAPCTRAIQPGEPERAGRWWWEQDSKKECGLHLGPHAEAHSGGLPHSDRATISP